MLKKLLVLISTLFIALAAPLGVSAHGAKIEYSVNMAVEIVATYDSGEPMGAAQVTVYAPDDPATPWLNGTTDEGGRFTFTPDPSIPGTWDVQVRQAGHGDIIHIPIGEGTASGGTSGFTPIQIVLMSASVIWGFVGTALYFSRKAS